MQQSQIRQPTPVRNKPPIAIAISTPAAPREAVQLVRAHCEGIALAYAAGSVVSYVAIKRDISERLTLERAAEFNRQLAQIGELTSGVVHELRNPLNPISNALQILDRTKGTDEAVRSACELMQRQLGQIVAWLDGECTAHGRTGADPNRRSPEPPG